jgi:hypothetical protein
MRRKTLLKIVLMYVQFPFGKQDEKEMIILKKSEGNGV